MPHPKMQEAQLCNRINVFEIIKSVGIFFFCCTIKKCCGWQSFSYAGVLTFLAAQPPLAVEFQVGLSASHFSEANFLQITEAEMGSRIYVADLKETQAEAQQEVASVLCLLTRIFAALYT